MSAYTKLAKSKRRGAERVNRRLIGPEIDVQLLTNAAVIHSDLIVQFVAVQRRESGFGTIIYYRCGRVAEIQLIVSAELRLYINPRYINARLFFLFLLRKTANVIMILVLDRSLPFDLFFCFLSAAFRAYHRLDLFNFFIVYL